MRGRLYATQGVLPERDLYELTDALACQIYRKLGRRVYVLSRQDVIEIIEPYIGDLVAEDRHALSWLVWDLFQEGLELEFQ